MNTYLLFKSLHLISVISWMAGLLYLPRIFVYHSQNNTQPVISDVFKIMERKLFWGIMTPGGILTILFGILLIQYHQMLFWLQLKIFLVGLLVLYHIWCGKIMYDFKNNKNLHGHVWYRVFNEVPVILLVIIVYLVVFKPF